MRIIDVQKQIGISKANLRYYEDEGLIHPQRLSNGYRDYSDEDINTLKKVKLLRELGISIEEIRQLQNHETSLSKVLQKRKESLITEEKELSKWFQMLDSMMQEEITYDQLNPEKLHFNSQNALLLKDDVRPILPHPFMRYFARSFDFALIEMMIGLFWLFILKNPFSSQYTFVVVQTILSALLILILEPFLISKFKTTPGKALMGISVTALDGNPLSYSQAFYRTFSILFWGYGCFVPGVNLIALKSAYTRCTQRKVMRWDEDCLPEIKEVNPWNGVILIVLNLVISLAMTGFESMAKLPDQNSPFTKEQFFENCAHVIRMNNYQNMKLTEDLFIHSYPKSNGIIYADPDKMNIELDMSFVEKEDEIIQLTVKYTTDYFLMESYIPLNHILISGFALSQDNASILDQLDLNLTKEFSVYEKEFSIKNTKIQYLPVREDTILTVTLIMEITN